MNNMTQGLPSKVIIRFMMPVLMGNLFQLTYSITDTRIVGTFLGDAALAGVGSAAVLHSLFNGFFMGIANGMAITISQFFGAKKMERLRGAFAASLVLGILQAAALVGVTLLMLGPILAFLNVPAELLPITKGYIRIIIAGMMVTMLYDICLASARAVGDSATPLFIMILSVLLNIAGDIFFLGVLRTGVNGAAIATVAAQFIALITCATYLYRKYSFIRVKKDDFRSIDGSTAYEMFVAGLSMGFMSSMINIGSLILQTAINVLGSSYIVAQTAARRITEVLMSIFVAMGQTLPTYAGQNFGAGNYRRIKEGMKFGYQVTIGWCVVVLVVVYLAAPTLIQMITGSEDKVMINAANNYLRTDTLLYFLVAIIFVQRTTLQGIGDRKTPLISSGIELTGKLILTLTIVPAMGYAGVILVEPIVWCVMIIPLILKVRSITRSEQWQS